MRTSPICSSRARSPNASSVASHSSELLFRARSKFRRLLAAAAAARAAGRTTFDGAVALGCVIRGETAHYDIVCNNANHWLMDVAMRQDVPVGNAILTVDTRAQAVARAEGGVRGKGGDAARACLRLIETKRAFWGTPA